MDPLRSVLRLVWVLAVWLTLTGSASAAEILWGLTTGNTLVRFPSASPGTPLVTLPITGLSGGEQVVAIEVEWTEGRLTGVSSAGRRYEINRTTGAATQLNASEAIVTPSGTAFGAADDGSFLVVVSENGSVVTINKIGGLQTGLPAATPAGRIVALAWRFPGQPQRVGIDSATDALFEVQLQSGVMTLVSIGALGVDTSDDAGLEFGPHDGVLYAALTVSGTPRLYTVNPATGQATLVGPIASAPIVSLTADMQGAPVITRQNPPPTEVSNVPESDTTLTFTVRRTGDDTVAADYAMTTFNTDGNPATSGEDYVPVSETLHFAPGVGEDRDADDPVRRIREPQREHIRLVATETTNQLASANALITIIDDDNQPPVLTMTFPSSSAITVSSPTVTLSGLVSDEDPGALVKLFRPEGLPFIPVATTTGSPWTFADVTLNPGVNGFTVEVTDIHGLSAFSHFTVTRATDTDRTYVFAEGATGGFFSTDLLFANPHLTNVPVTVDFLREDGTVVTHTLTVPAQQRATLLVDSIPGLETTATAAVARTAQASPIVVERTMRWNESGYGASTEKAATALSRTWYFAEGSQGFFSTFLLLVNPQEASNDVTLRFLREGEGPIAKTYTMLPRQRLTIDTGTVPELVNTSFGVEVTFAEPGMTERAMYFGRQALWDAGHESAGVPAAATDWFLAEGATGEFFETFVLIANPSNSAADVTMTYLPEGGASVTRMHQVPANGRLTVNIEVEDAALANLGAVGTRLTSTVPVVVERSQYWPFSPFQWYEAHNSFGQTETAMHWGLAEGRVGGAAGYKTYILLANAETSATAPVTVTFLRENDTPVIKTFAVPPASRLTIDVGSAQVPEITDGSFGADIVSNVPIAVERAMYSNANGQFWAAGTNAAATRLPQRLVRVVPLTPASASSSRLPPRRRTSARTCSSGRRPTADRA